MPNWTRIYTSNNIVQNKAVYHYLLEHDIQVRIIQQSDSVYTVFANQHLEVPDFQEIEAKFLIQSYFSNE